jgi:mono/diheme cytochrome c family protein
MAVLCAAVGCGAQTVALPRFTLHSTRQSAGDLEIGGELAGVPAGETRFVRYAELLKLPLETDVVSGDTNFGKTVTITGVRLERLPALLGAAPGAAMVTAIADDGYAGHYPAAYVKAHHPLLVLKVNGEPPARWPLGVDKVPMGPYLVSHPGFRPAFRVLAHEDEAQVPWGVVRLDFDEEREVYAPILSRGKTSRGNAANEELVQQGYTIARQNCFRCHRAVSASAGSTSGPAKSSVSWGAVAQVAMVNPQFFDAYVVNPKKLNPASQMAASPQYDAATLRALRAYFAEFKESPQ